MDGVSGASMEQFKLKDVYEVSAFLKENGIDDCICEKFEDEDIDGQAFLELDDAEIKTLGQKIGVVKKLHRLKDSILSNSEVESPSQASPGWSHSSPGMSFSTPARRPSLLSPQSPDLHETPPFSPLSASDDNVSLSSATSLNKKGSTTAFQIPDTWRPSIMQCLQRDTDEERRLELDTSRRNEVVRDLVTQMFAFDPKPNSAFAAVVAKKLVRKYPFMKDIGDKVSGYGSWEKRIIERINNQRGQAMRKRPRSDDDTSTPAKRGRPKESTLLCRYPALQLDDGHSDEVSLSRNQAKLNEEASKTNPSKAAILPLQRMTYVKRREFILSGLDAIGIILEEHPLLRHPFALEIEMDLVTDQNDCFKKAVEKWKNIGPAIINYSESFSGKLGSTLKKVRDDNQDEELCAFMILVKILGKKETRTKEDPLLFAFEKCKITEDPKDLLKNRARMSAPRFALFGESTYYIVVEGNILCEVSSFSRAICLWFATHYIFNLEYSKPLKEVCLFIQEFVFKLPQTTKKTATYLTTSSDILKYLF